MRKLLTISVLAVMACSTGPAPISDEGEHKTPGAQIVADPKPEAPAPAPTPAPKLEPGGPQAQGPGFEATGLYVLQRREGPWVYERDGVTIARGFFQRDRFVGDWRYDCAHSEGLSCFVRFEDGEPVEWRTEVGTWVDRVTRQESGLWRREVSQDDVTLVRHAMMPEWQIDAWIPTATNDDVATWGSAPFPYGANHLRVDRGRVLGAVSYFVVPSECHGPYSVYDKSGALREEGTCDLGRRQGVMRQYAPGGARVLEEHFEAGVRQGVSRAWYENGQLHVEREFVDNTTLVGKWARWYEDGGKHSAGQFGAVDDPEEAGWPHGAWQFWHVGGKRAAAGDFVAGRKGGPWKYWTADGKDVLDPCEPVLRIEIDAVRHVDAPEHTWASQDERTRLHHRLTPRRTRCDGGVSLPPCLQQLQDHPLTWGAGTLAARLVPRARPSKTDDDVTHFPTSPRAAPAPVYDIDILEVDNPLGINPRCVMNHMGLLLRHMGLEFRARIIIQPPMAFRASPDEGEAPGRRSPCRRITNVTDCQEAAHCGWQRYEGVQDSFTSLLAGSCAGNDRE